MIEAERAREVVDRIRGLPGTGREFRQGAMEILARLPGWDWVGVYRLEGRLLVLDAFVGEPTEHREIPVGVGVCGSAVAQDRNQIVPDVAQRPDYLACSWKTRSEIVVLVRGTRGILGQIDVDGHRLASFDASDEAFLEEVAAILADRWEESPEARQDPGT